MRSKKRRPNLLTWYKKVGGSQEKGVQLLEFAFILPFLLAFVVGIVDFGGGYRIYQNVTNATREGARLSASRFYNQPTTAPDKLRDRITSYLASLGLETSYYAGVGTKATGTTTWRYGNYPTGAYLLIDQSRTFPKLDGSGNPTGINYAGSYVELNYPYSYIFFGRVIQLLIPSASYNNQIYIKNRTLIQNEN